MAPEYEELFRDETADQRPQARESVPPRFLDKYDAYDRSIVETDAIVGRFLDAIERVGLSERTLVVLISDHGEAFGAHRVSGHGRGGFDDQIRIPWLLRGPGIPAAMRIDTPASILDIGPTLIDLIGLEPLPLAQGLSLAPALRGQSMQPDRALLIEWLNGGAAVRRGRYKLIERPLQILDLEADPFERDALEGRTELTREMQAALADLRQDSIRRAAQLRALGEQASGGRPPAAPPSSEDLMESLRALGYLE